MTKLNPIEQVLVERGIRLPETPVSLRHLFERANVTSTYVIAMTGRCGSTWLATTLKQIDGSGEPVEYFSEEGLKHFGNTPENGNIEDFFYSLIQEHKTGSTFGFKIDGHRLKWLEKVIDIPGSFSSNHSKWIDMRRMNVIKQAISFQRAKKTGLWHVFKDTNNQHKASQDIDVGISHEDIWKEISAIRNSECFLDFFYERTNINPLELKYEELLDSRDQVLCRVLHHLFPSRDIEIPVNIENQTKKVSDIKHDILEIAFCTENAARVAELYQRKQNRSKDLVGTL